jgi:hypothetical protein
MYKWYISIEIDGKTEVIRSNKDSYDDVKREIKELYPKAQILGYVQLKPFK